MTMIAPIAGCTAAFALLLMAVGFLRIACNIDAPVLCRACLAIGATEILGGAWIWIGLLAVMGGYL